jgi:hypothetical protein
MRKILSAVLFMAFVAAPAALPGKDKVYSAPRAFHAKTYPAHETHDDEKFSIAADPYDMPDKTAGVFTVNYKDEGLLPIFLIFSNDGDQPVSLMNMKVTLITRKRVKIDPSQPEDVYRRLTRATARPDDPSRFPLPRRKNKGISAGARDEVENSQFLARAVEAHANQAGFLFFDVQGLDNPLAGARLEITGLMDAKGKELFFFEIPMEKYLGYQPVRQLSVVSCQLLVVSCQ